MAPLREGSLHVEGCVIDPNTEFATPMKTTLVLLATLLLGVTAAAAKVNRPTDDDVLQAACYPDVQRLCKDEIPDEAKITTCMERKKAMVSRKCKEAAERLHRTE